MNHYNRYNNYNRYGGANGNWNHNPAHRGAAPYGDRNTANRYGGATRGNTAATRPSQPAARRIRRDGAHTAFRWRKQEWERGCGGQRRPRRQSQYSQQSECVEPKRQCLRWSVEQPGERQRRE